MKKKVILSIICIVFSFVVFCSCGANVQPKELTFRGNEVSLVEAIDYLDGKTNEASDKTVKEQWYSVSGAFSIKSDTKTESVNIYSDATYSITGKYFITDDLYNIKLKLDIQGIGTQQYAYNQKIFTYQTDKNFDYACNLSVIYVHGLFYVKYDITNTDKTNKTETEKKNYISMPADALNDMFEYSPNGLINMLFTSDASVLLDKFSEIRENQSDIDKVECHLDTKANYIALGCETLNKNSDSLNDEAYKEQIAVKFKENTDIAESSELYVHTVNSSSSEYGSSFSDIVMSILVKTSSSARITEPRNCQDYQYSEKLF